MADTTIPAIVAKDNLISHKLNGQAAVSSLDVARHFQKNHKNVLQDITRIISNCPKSFTGLNFQLSDYTDPTGRALPAYLLTRDAFALLAMGFTGAAALRWKLKYIEAFNALEAAALAGLEARIRDARSQAALAALALAPWERERITRALGYFRRGFTQREAAAVMGIHRRTLQGLVKKAKELGLPSLLSPSVRREDSPTAAAPERETARHLPEARHD